MNREQQINQILSNFNFERVQEVMRLRPSDWWLGASGNIPTVYELAAFARELLEKASEPTEFNCSSVACGGFHALRWPWNEGENDCTMQLIFSAEDFNA